MKNTILRLSVCTFALSASAIALGQTEVPNTFQAGQSARAADVNANFDTVESAIDANSARIDANETATQNNTLSISQMGGASGVGAFDQNGRELGKFMGMRRINADDNTFYVISSKGFVFAIDASGNVDNYLEKSHLYYTGVDCTGNAYINRSGWLNGWALHTGVVTRAGPINSEGLFYTERGGSQQFDVSIQSVQYVGNTVTTNNALGIPGCYNSAPTGGPTSVHGFVAIPNDEGVTDVLENPPVGAVVLGTPP